MVKIFFLIFKILLFLFFQDEILEANPNSSVTVSLPSTPKPSGDTLSLSTPKSVPVLTTNNTNGDTPEKPAVSFVPTINLSFSSFPQTLDSSTNTPRCEIGSNVGHLHLSSVFKFSFSISFLFFILLFLLFYSISKKIQKKKLCLIVLIL